MCDCSTSPPVPGPDFRGGAYARRGIESSQNSESWVIPTNHKVGGSNPSGRAILPEAERQFPVRGASSAARQLPFAKSFMAGKILLSTLAGFLQGDRQSCGSRCEPAACLRRGERNPRTPRGLLVFLGPPLPPSNHSSWASGFSLFSVPLCLCGTSFRPSSVSGQGMMRGTRWRSPQARNWDPTRSSRRPAQWLSQLGLEAFANFHEEGVNGFFEAPIRRLTAIKSLATEAFRVRLQIDANENQQLPPPEVFHLALPPPGSSPCLRRTRTF